MYNCNERGIASSDRFLKFGFVAGVNGIDDVGDRVWVVCC